MVMEVFLDPNRDVLGDDTIRLTQHNVSKAIKDSILVNFGQCGLASSQGSFQVNYVNPITKLCIIRASRDEYQKVWSAVTMVTSIGNCEVYVLGSLKACKTAALKCDEVKFEQYKLVAGANCSSDGCQSMQNHLHKLKILEHSAFTCMNLRGVAWLNKEESLPWRFENLLEKDSLAKKGATRKIDFLSNKY